MTNIKCKHALHYQLSPGISGYTTVHPHLAAQVMCRSQSGKTNTRRSAEPVFIYGTQHKHSTNNSMPLPEVNKLNSDFNGMLQHATICLRLKLRALEKV